MSTSEQKIEKRVIITAKYIVNNNSSIVNAFKNLKIFFQKENIPFSEATIHSDIKNRLLSMDNHLYEQVINVIQQNTTEKNNISIENIVFEHDENGVSFKDIAQQYNISKTAVYEKYVEYKLKNEIPKFITSDEHKREQIEDNICKLANYALIHHSTIDDLSRQFNYSKKELTESLSELLPILDYDLYFVLKNQLNLLDETNEFGKKRK